MGNQNESVLKIILDEGTRPVVESLKDKDTSLFRELYDKTFLSIEQYLSSVGYEKGVEKDDSNAVDKKERIVKTDNPNNIIAFLGERGSGKTSCMLSVAQMLQDKSNNNKIQIKNGDNAFASLNATRFVHVETIEPSFIDDKANVLELVIAKLFKTFKEKVEKDTQNINANLKHELIKHFQNVQEDLQYCKNGNSELDTIDSLQKLSSNADLKQHLQELVDTYLKFVTNDSNENKILLLAIDDIDLNTQYAYAMVEQIRKYLILPNLLILVSLKLDQLEQVLRNEFIKQFEKSLNYPKENNPLVSDIQQMAERYIQKLIPLDHRIFMPDMEAAMDKPYVVYRTKEEALGNYTNDCENYKNDGSKVLKHQILASIFEKTRFLFYNTKGKASYIIPRNLREFCNLASMLYNLPDNNNSEEDPTGNCYNKTIFKKYFYGTWCENNLSVEKNVLFKEIISVQDAVDINITVLKVLKMLLSEEILKELQSADEYKYILSEKNYKWNISLGDVMAILNYYESHSVSLDDLKFVFAVKTHYSIKLYEYYNELTSNPIQKLYSNQDCSNEEESTRQVIRKDNMFGHSNYAKLIGGSFIHSGIVKLLPDQGRYRNSRSQRMINFSIIRDMMEKIAAKLTILPDEKEKLTTEQKVLLLNITQQIRLIEFFLLLSSRKYDSKNETQLNKYREFSDIWYSAKLSDVKKNLGFDITSCFFNCLDIETTYDRVSDVFLKSLKKFDKLVDEKNKSLSFQIEKYCYEGRKKGNKRQRHYSQLAIRNIEVLDDLVSVRSIDTDFGNSVDKDVYERFFEKLSDYSILTYDNNNKKYNKINFSPFKVLKEFLHLLDGEYILCLKLILFGSFYYEDIVDYYSSKTRSPFSPREYEGERIIRILISMNRGYHNSELLEKKLMEYFKENKFYGQKSMLDNCIMIEKELAEYDKQIIDGFLWNNHKGSEGISFQYNLKGYKNDKNRRQTIINKMIKQNPNFPDRTKLVEILEKKFTESHYDRAQIEEICTQIAQELTSQN